MKSCQVSNEKFRGFVFLGGMALILAIYVGYIVNNYADCSETTRIQWKVRVVFLWLKWGVVLEVVESIGF